MNVDGSVPELVENSRDYSLSWYRNIRFEYLAIQVYSSEWNGFIIIEELPVEHVIGPCNLVGLHRIRTLLICRRVQGPRDLDLQVSGNIDEVKDTDRGCGGLCLDHGIVPWLSKSEIRVCTDAL